MSGRVSAFLVCAASVVAWIAPAWSVAQTASPEEYAANAVRRVALMDLRSRTEPTPDDYLVADHVLAAASALAPEDAELVRSRIRAAWAAGDSERVDELTRTLVRLDPKDTVAQLRLASSRIDAMQTIEERLAAYDRLLGPAGERIDASVRSRLALDSALLLRETGNFTAFTERLTQSMQLDGTNKEAATLAWTALGGMVESRPQRVELLLNLLLADPTDPNVHRQLAIELALAGDFAQARRFHNLALGMYVQEGAPQTESLLVEAVIIGWQVEGPETVVEALNNRVGIMRAQAESQIMQYEQARMPTDSLPRPEEVRLPPNYNQIRLVAAMMAEDEQTIEATLADMTREFQEVINRANEVSGLSTQEERARALATLWGQMTEQIIAVSWAEKQTEAVSEWSERAAQMLGDDSPAVKVLRGWRELRYGDPELAVQLFTDVQADTPLNRVGLGLALEAVGRPEEAVDQYRRLALGLPMSLSGVWARSKCEQLTGVDPLETPARTAVNRLAAGVPAWVDRMCQEPRSFMQLRCELLDTSLGATETAAVRVRLTNIAPIPLGVGGDRPINSRLLFAPTLQIGLENEYAGAQPEVVELNRRLRLQPTESIEVVVSPEAGFLGWLAETGALQAVRQRWRVLQGYSLDGRGVPTVGPLCLETTTGRLARAPLKLGHLPAIELADAFDAASESELPAVLAAIRARSLVAEGAEHAMTVDDRARIAAIAADRYRSASFVTRAMMLSVLPTTTMAPGMETFDAAAMEEADPVLIPLAMVTRVTEPGDPALAALIEGEDEQLAEFARALRSRLESPAATFSRLPAGSLRPRGSGQR